MASRFVRAAALRIVEVAVRRRRHHDVVSGVGGCDAALRAAPGHDDGAGCQAAFEDFIPADQSPAAAGQELLDAVVQVRLQLRLGP